MGIFGDNKKKEPNKFEGKRKYSIRAGVPEKTLQRLKDLHEMLHCDPDDRGYVVTTFEEMMQLTEIDSNSITIMIHNGMIRKATTGGSPKYKYKWDTIKPTMDMARTIINKKLDLKKPKAAKDVVSESKPESTSPESEEEHLERTDNAEIIEKKELSIHTETDALDSSVIMDSKVDGDIMTMHVNLTKLGITESAVLNAVLAINSNK